ncbi:hypothetical protein BJ508DRAFT_50274 [Ascobolus immersus RN42]|uniref:Uncharacterized protein n=1 Tax=Ascobolus immersus RN42 TaxID=1160509 RepID=A0A3N4HH98_ASCIM|nr:hypothetical protein BJ508DRAFT_50274 [Ascobolus immersus RN42]
MLRFFFEKDLARWIQGLLCSRCTSCRRKRYPSCDRLPLTMEPDRIKTRGFAPFLSTPQRHSKASTNAVNLTRTQPGRFFNLLFLSTSIMANPNAPNIFLAPGTNQPYVNLIGLTPAGYLATLRTVANGARIAQIASINAAVGQPITSRGNLCWEADANFVPVENGKFLSEYTIEECRRTIIAIESRRLRPVLKAGNPAYPLYKYRCAVCLGQAHLTHDLVLHCCGRP